MTKIKEVLFPPGYVPRTVEQMVREENEKASTREDRNCMTFWFPKILAAGLPVPKTVFAAMPEAAQIDVWGMIDHKPDQKPEAWLAFVEDAKRTADEIGYPLFLRTGHTSGKHEWNRTCYVPARDVLREHIFSIIYFSECCGMFGELPWRTWAFREYLPINPIATAPHYEGMPICREFRFFAEDGKVLCRHPYWPREALERGACEITEAQIADMWALPDPAPLIEIAEAASKVCGGAWSVDLLETERGWFLTDMAMAQSSYHWPECPRLSTTEE